jgi:arylsulfatase A-like enzyme
MRPDGRLYMISVVPNVLYLVWDDARIATWNAFGGLIDTPSMKWLAGRGLRYCQWHTPALSSPTRCALLTGRNGPARPMALTGPSGPARSGPGDPRRRERSVVIPPDTATLAEILGGSGYRTYCVGKWHLSPAEAGAVANSRATWPLGRGFDRFYGFLGGQTSPWYPDLVFDNQNVDPPYPPAEGYHLNRDLADMATEFIRDGLRTAPQRPWFCYLALGGHDTAQAAPQEWADAGQGRFDMGYDRYREIVLGNMKRMGLMPESAGLAPADGHPARGAVPDEHLARPWRGLDEEQKRLSSSIAESYAGLCSYTDHQIGRLLDCLAESGQLNDTIVVACSANAMNPSGPVQGYGEVGEGFPAVADGATGEDPADRDELAAGWAWAFGAPYNVSRQCALGGTAASPLIISWPSAMTDVMGGVRDQYHHAVDIVPTILDCAGVEPPPTANGLLRAPLHGVSMRYTFAAPDAPSARPTQLYRTAGGCAIYCDGWKAVTGSHRWELYQVSTDRAETRNVAADRPDKLAELAALAQVAGSDHVSEPEPTVGPARAPQPCPVTTSSALTTSLLRHQLRQRCGSPARFGPRDGHGSRDEGSDGRGGGGPLRGGLRW